MLFLPPPANALNDSDVATLDARFSRFDYRPGQVIVKFKDQATVRLAAKRAAVGLSDVDAALSKIGASNMEALMPLSGASTLRRSVPGINGKPVVAKPMDKAFVLNITADVHQAIEVLLALDEVEYVEPNYTVHSLATETPDDPFYTQQYGIEAINLYKLWGEPCIRKEGPVVAVIDTGVDITHPDLKDNIWTNEREQSGVSGYDDDGNGFQDDVHGWDFVNQTGKMADHNGHGTHCAGIIGARGYNGIGIVGACPFARIMPLAALQGDGAGDIATLIKAIDYAAANGAEVISMSLGTYAESQALGEALGRAYQKAVIVAAAGNDGKCLNHAHPEMGQQFAMPMFPAAYTFVLGVQASGADGSLAGFTNYDDNGPVYSEYSDEKLYNYELTAPGVSIVSTYPGGNYKKLSGTSMATPLVAGAICRYMMSREVTNKEELFGDLIHTAKGNLDIFAAYSITDADRRPTLALVGTRLDDEKMGDGDGRLDAGETVRLYPKFRNSWGNAHNISYKLVLDELEDPEIVEWMDADESHMLSGLSSYASAESESPFIFKVSPNCADGRRIKMKLTATCDNISAPLEQDLIFSVENGVELKGILSKDMTLTPDKNYIITGNFAVPEGVTLTIEPGTTIKLKENANFQTNGIVVAKGRPNQMITFTMADNTSSIGGNIKFGNNIAEYCIFKDINTGAWIPAEAKEFVNCVFTDNGCGFAMHCSIFYNCNIYNYYRAMANSTFQSFEKNTNIINNKFDAGLFIRATNVECSNVFSNYRGDKLAALDYITDETGKYTPVYPSYLGSSKTEIVRTHICDIYQDYSGSFGEYDLSNMLTRPVHEAHGIVWKVVVNDYDAQDEYELMPPLGVGRHKFEVYFNREMDHSVAPMIAMGVRAPYTQTAIGEDVSWRTEEFDGEKVDIYTAYLTITGRQNIDGVNRIYVADARDDEFFDIPIEDVRFNVNVQAAGSLSTGFFGESGVGCVKLEWEDMDINFEDILGYNIYRSTADSEPVRINDHLIEAGTTNYTDYDVKTGTTYLYYYKVMTTALTENDPSKTIAVTPLTAEMGDANGSGTVDVNDILTTVNYIGGADPKPFIYEAADMNADNDINILDVVGIAHAILGGNQAQSLAELQTAYYWIEDGMLWLRNADAVGGIQLQLSTAGNRAEMTPTGDLAKFETMGQWNGNDYIFLGFSLNGASLPVGDHAIMAIDPNMTIENIVLGDTSASTRSIPVERANWSGIDNVKVDVKACTSKGVYNIMGVKIADNESVLDRMPAGVYIVNGQKRVIR